MAGSGVGVTAGYLIGLCGAPSAGKTTTAHALRAELRGTGATVEAVREYARHWIERCGVPEGIFEQMLIQDGQTKWERQAQGIYDVVISDSPRWLSYIYATALFHVEDTKSHLALVRLYELALRALKDYNRIYLLPPPVCVSQDRVRIQNEDDAIYLHGCIYNFLRMHNVEFHQFESGMTAQEMARVIATHLGADMLESGG